MPESTLSSSFQDIHRDLADWMGFGRRISVSQGLSVNQYDAMIASVKSGFRQVYVPPVLPKEQHPHRWSWLEPFVSFTVWPVTTGTITNISGDTFDDSDGPFLSSMAGHSVVTSSSSYLITQVFHSKHVRVTPVMPGSELNEDFTITPDGTYRLPDDFGALVGPLFYGSGDGPWDPITIRGVSHVTQEHQRTNSTGRPRYAAVTPLSYDTDLVEEPDSPWIRGQRFALMLAPIPDQLYTLRFRYSILPDALPYNRDGEWYQTHPWGGMAYTELFLASCRAAAANLYMRERFADAWADFMLKLVAAVNRDRLASSADELGVCTDPSVEITPRYWRDRHWSEAPVTYDGA